MTTLERLTELTEEKRRIQAQIDRLVAQAVAEGLGWEAIGAATGVCGSAVRLRVKRRAAKQAVAPDGQAAAQRRSSAVHGGR